MTNLETCLLTAWRMRVCKPKITYLYSSNCCGKKSFRNYNLQPIFFKKYPKNKTK